MVGRAARGNSGSLCNYMHMNADKHVAPEDFSVAAEIFRLLADPTRVGLLHALAGREEELSVNELATAVGRRQAAVSQHLARLRMARLVTTRKLGNQVIYRLANEHVKQLVLDGVRHAEHLGTGVPSHHQESPQA